MIFNHKIVSVLSSFQVALLPARVTPVPLEPIAAIAGSIIALMTVMATVHLMEFVNAAHECKNRVIAFQREVAASSDLKVHKAVHKAPVCARATEC